MSGDGDDREDDDKDDDDNDNERQCSGTTATGYMSRSNAHAVLSSAQLHLHDGIQDDHIYVGTLDYEIQPGQCMIAIAGAPMPDHKRRADSDEMSTLVWKLRRIDEDGGVDWYDTIYSDESIPVEDISPTAPRTPSSGSCRISGESLLRKMG